MPDDEQPQDWRRVAGFGFGMIDWAIAALLVHWGVDLWVHAHAADAALEPLGMAPKALAMLLTGIFVLLIPIHIWLQRHPLIPGLTSPKAAVNICGIGAVLWVWAVFYALRCYNTWAMVAG